MLSKTPLNGEFPGGPAVGLEDPASLTARPQIPPPLSAGIAPRAARGAWAGRGLSPSAFVAWRLQGAQLAGRMAPRALALSKESGWGRWSQPFVCVSLSALDSAARVCSVSPAWRGGETRGAPAVGQALGARPLCPAAVRLLAFSPVRSGPSGLSELWFLAIWVFSFLAFPLAWFINSEIDTWICLLAHWIKLKLCIE